MRKSLVVFSMMVSLVFLLVGCGGGEVTPPANQAPQIQTTSPSVVNQTIKVGETLNFSVTATDPDGDNLTYVWSSTNGQLNTTTGTQVIWTAPAQPGTAEVTVTVSDSVAVDSHKWIITVTENGGGGDTTGQKIVVDRDITVLTTWETGKVYVIDGNITASAPLVIQPGTIVKFMDGDSLTISETGTIKAQGTLAQPIIFTSYKDDTYGGDTNNDGTVTDPAVGDWESITVYNTSGSIFDYCEFYYGGSGYYEDSTVCIYDSNTTVTNSIFAYNNGADDGVVNAAYGRAGMVIQNNTFYANAKPMKINPNINLDDSNLFNKPEDGTVTNAFNGIFVDTNNVISTQVNWAVTQVPFVITGSLYTEENSSLTLGDGVILKFPADENIQVGGVIIANGTNGIIFTSYKDDAHGGDTNGDGSITTPAAGDWEGIFLSYQNGSVFNNCEFYYGGSEYYVDAVLSLSGTVSTVTNSIFAHNLGAEYAALDASDALTGTIIQNNIFYDNIQPLMINGDYIELDDSNIFHNPANSTVTNERNGIFVESAFIDGALSWAETEVPFVFNCDLVIAEGAALTLGDYVILKFHENNEINHHSNLNNYNGTGVYFTSYRDDVHGGDTNGDGSATSPMIGDWDGVYSNVVDDWVSWPNALYTYN